VSKPITSKLLTFIVCFGTVARNYLENVILAVSILQFVPDTLTMIRTTAVTQLDSDVHPNCLATLCIISTKSTIKIAPSYFTS